MVKRNQRDLRRAPIAAPVSSTSNLALLLCFTLSGATGLIYQTVWTRLLVLVFGSAMPATAIILAVFMGGLALGSAGAGRVLARVARPVRLYAFIEGLVGLYSILVPFLLTGSEAVYRWGWQHYGGASAPLTFLRLLLTGLILLPPTILMGATLPLLSRFVVQASATRSAPVGALYSANLLGAVAGAALSGFLLLPALGSLGTTLLTAALNFLLLSLAWRLDLRTPEGDPPVATVSASSSVVAPIPHGAWAAGLCFALSGVLAMLYEVVWTRALGLVIGSNSYAFTVMLSAFLMGLFLGSACATHTAPRVCAPLVALGLVQTLAAACTFIAYRLFDWLPWWNLRLFALLPHSPEYALLARLLLCMVVLLPPAVCLGAVFPFVLRAYDSAPADAGRIVGRLYAGNTLGAIAGALLSGFWLIPRFGVQTTLRGALATQAVLGLVVVGIGMPADRPRRAWLIPAVAIAVVALFPLPGWNDLALVMAQSARRAVADVRPFPYASRAQFLEELTTDQKLLFIADGATSHVAVVENPVNRSLLTNGHADASNRGDMPNQILLAALPLLLHSSPSPERVGVIGWGSGVTAGAALRFPLRSLTAVELEPAVVTASEWFRDVNHDAARDPRVQIIPADGRNYLMATSDRFDIIISEPSNAWQAGVCNLFTREFFARARDRLKNDGLLTLWIGYGGIPASEVRGVLAALQGVFPHALLFRSSHYDLIAVASRTPLRIALAEAAARMEWPSVKADLALAGVDSVPSLLSRLLAGDTEIAVLRGDESPNTDDNARLEYTVARVYELGSHGQEMMSALRRLDRRGLSRYLNFNGVSEARRETSLRALGSTAQ